MTWVTLSPPLRAKDSLGLFISYARKLSRLKPSDDQGENIADLVEDVRRKFVEELRARPPRDRQVLLATGLVLADLVAQGWPLRVRRGALEVRPPDEVVGDPAAEKTRVRRQELVRTGAQLRQPAVRKFIRSMERPRFHNGRFTSMFSLMRDGRELADSLKEARLHSNNGWAAALERIVCEQACNSDQVRGQTGVQN